MRVFVLSLLIGLVVAAGNPPAGGGPAVTARPSLADAVAVAIGAARAAHGEGGLARDTGFDGIAEGHARDMVVRDFWAHISPDGDGPGERVFARFPDYAGNIGENLGYRKGREFAETEMARNMVERWLDSPPHRKNLLGEAFRCLGVGAVQHGDELFVVMMLGSEPTDVGTCDRQAPENGGKSPLG